MPAKRKQMILLGLVLSISSVLLVAGDKKSKSKAADASIAQPAQMDDDKRIIHALNRFTFGVRPGDVERVRAMGLDKWLDEQLHPEKIDDSAAEARLEPFRTLKMSTREIVQNFPSPQVLKAVENGRMAMPSDPAKKAVYESRMAAYQQRQENKQDKADGGNNPEMNNPEQMQGRASANGDSTPPEMRPGTENASVSDQRKQQRREAAMYADLDADKLLKMEPEERYQSILKMPAEERLDVAKNYKGPKALQLVDGMKPEQRETIEAIMQPAAAANGELAQAKLLRAIYSNRQLEEVMTDFWYNHFNVFLGKGQDRYMINAYERDVIRPHALGKFKDILASTAKSPAMLFYLDNWQSVGPNSDLAVYGQQRRGRFRYPVAAKNRRNGLNENYAREIMELHTLGVDGGYTQKDVTELAKVLTGWGIEQPQLGGSFRFNERAHEPGPKYVLGYKIDEGGEKEGDRMLDILAHHPSTAKFISRKLAMRFVSDNPPQTLVDRMAETFQKKDGDIREVLRTMFHSPEFWAADAYRAKMKTPFEFVVSAARVSGADIQNALPLVATLNRMGMPLYGMQPPTGYSMKADAWVNSSALLNRMNFALALGSGKLPGTSLDTQALLQGSKPADADHALAALEQRILAGDVSPQTHAVMEKQLSDPRISQRKLDDSSNAPNYGAIAGLIMGSPEFQRR
ncbi:MAG TPA: DUF1800 domain-containing protein [Candidatus Angelobacter sp.]|nr:DUF1800 domain-containing protein [Candidatus Angelobacter sp.]